MLTETDTTHPHNTLITCVCTKLIALTKHLAVALCALHVQRVSLEIFVRRLAILTVSHTDLGEGGIFVFALPALQPHSKHNAEALPRLPAVWQGV